MKRVAKEGGRGGGGGVSSTVHEQNKKKTKDHAFNNFVYLNHENKQVRYSL